LAAFGRGELPAARLEAVADHVSGCARCEASLLALFRDDPLADYLRRRPEQRTPVDESLCRELEARARVIPFEQTGGLTTSPDGGPATLAEGPPMPVAFGPYQLLECLGEGGMGVVYKARDEAVKRLVALKRVRAGAYATSEERERFRREAEAVARLRHPNVVQIHHFGEHQGQPYFAMELLEGGSLAGKLAGRPMPEREAAQLVQTLARAMHYAHAHGIVHRDLKPGNVLFAEDGTPKITDFGLVKLLDSERGQTVSEAILGTPAYMAPEQARGASRDIGPAADVYALGAILYEALTGRPPFGGVTKLETLEQVRSREPDPLSRHRPGLSRTLEAICLQCLAKEPTRRYPSAEVLADDLRAWLENRPTRVRPPGSLGRLGLFLRRHPRWVTAAALGLFLSVGGWLASVYFDPARPINRIEAELARGHTQTLIGEKGGPRWMRWREGQATSQTSVTANGTFSVHSWGQALLELVRDPQSEHYQFRALVRHDKSDDQGEVGIYVAHRGHGTPRGVVDHFVALTFYDLRDEMDLYKKLLPKFPKVPPPPKGNPVLFDPRLYAERPEGPWEPRLYCGPRGYFKPAGAGGKEWRELAVEVTPEGVRGFWAGRPIGTLSAKLAAGAARDYLAQRRQEHPDDPLFQGVEPVFAPCAGLGLYVHKGSASFRRVEIEPLADAP
jgi:serine/threonine-protein kinase